MQDPSLYVRAERVLWRQAGPVILVLPLDEAADVVELQGTGVALWEVFTVPTTIARAAAELSDAFDADPAEVERDLAAIVPDLTRRGVIERFAS